MRLCSSFESSGVLAAALDTATLPYRLHSSTAPPDLGPATGAAQNAFSSFARLTRDERDCVLPQTVFTASYMPKRDQAFACP